jgi:hypothetical protein
MPSVRFPLSRIVGTPGALEALARTGETADSFLARHSIGNWGDLDETDKTENEIAVSRGFRILSAYRLADGTRIWVITEADRSSTTILLPEEY